MSIIINSYLFKVGLVRSAIWGVWMVFFYLLAEGIHLVVIHRDGQIHLIASCYKQEIKVVDASGNGSKPNRFKLTKTVIFSVDAHTLFQTKVPDSVVNI
jgi:hypothetical protein